VSLPDEMGRPPLTGSVTGDNLDLVGDGLDPLTIR
jgi:hypothetical protein